MVVGGERYRGKSIRLFVFGCRDKTDIKIYNANSLCRLRGWWILGADLFLASKYLHNADPPLVPHYKWWHYKKTSWLEPILPVLPAGAHLSSIWAAAVSRVPSYFAWKLLKQRKNKSLDKHLISYSSIDNFIFRPGVNPMNSLQPCIYKLVKSSLF